MWSLGADRKCERFLILLVSRKDTVGKLGQHMLQIVMQLPDTAAWFWASKIGLPVEYYLPSISKDENRVGSICCAGSEQRMRCTWRSWRKSPASNLVRPCFTIASNTASCLRPAIISGRGVLTDEVSCLSEGGGECGPCNVSGER